MDHIIYECDNCGSFHPWNWNGDCREEASRFTGPEEYAERNNISENAIEMRPFDYRFMADAVEYASFEASADITATVLPFTPPEGDTP